MTTGYVIDVLSVDVTNKKKDEGDLYYWSFVVDKEVWTDHCNTIDECLDEAKCNNEDGSNTVFIGLCEYYTPGVSAIDILEQMYEDASEECGEAADGWLDGIDNEKVEELEVDLNEVIKAWINDYNLKPSFGKFTDSWEYDLQSRKMKQPKL